MRRGIEIVLSGTAKVYCVHDREKRLVKSPDDCLRLAREAGLELAAFPKFQTCGCCDNVFAAIDDTPQLCSRCSGLNAHKLGGALNEPIEGVLLMAKTYECKNPACTLGTVANPGRFSGGISKEQVNLLTGKPLEQLKSGEDYGAGFCPNCGQEGREV